jgi:hypothetical protein
MNDGYRVTSWAGALYVVEEVRTGESVFWSLNGAEAYDVMDIGNQLRVWVER